MTDLTIENFLSKFVNAIKNIKQDYYSIETIYRKQGIPRERVYCYELYHQLRLKFNNDLLIIHGELDKSGHIDFQDPKRVVPDFLIHQPGTHKNNFVIIEVKGVIKRKKIIGDLEKIYKLINNSTIHYQYGIFLLYGYSFDDLVRQISREDLALIKNNHDEKIYIICSEKEGARIYKKKLSDLRK